MGFKSENNCNEFKEKFLSNFRKASQEVLISEVAEIQANTPVGTKEKGSKAPGTLKRSITGYNEMSNGIMKIRFGSKVIYARKVEFKDKSYIRGTLKRDISRVADIFNRYIKESES